MTLSYDQIKNLTVYELRDKILSIAQKRCKDITIGEKTKHFGGKWGIYFFIHNENQFPDLTKDNKFFCIGRALGKYPLNVRLEYYFLMVGWGGFIEANLAGIIVSVNPGTDDEGKYPLHDDLAKDKIKKLEELLIATLQPVENKRGKNRESEFESYKNDKKIKEYCGE